MASGINVVVSILIIKSYRSRSNRKINVVLYGHTLSGNLYAFYRYVTKERGKEVNVNFLTMSPGYSRKLYKDDVNVLLTFKLHDMIKVRNADFIITDHGLHVMILYLMFTSIKIIDVWHGIPFKGFKKTDFNFLRRYDEIWVTSKLLKKIYVNKYIFDEEKVKPIGYARTDLLINCENRMNSLRRKYGVKNNIEKIILLAPTWRHNRGKELELPFGMSAEGFWNGLNELAKSNNCLLIYRLHLNENSNVKVESTNIKTISTYDHPNTEELLLISDILISDWSSIVFDYLVLQRPTIFIDIEPPFNHGFTIDPEFRYGKIVDNYRELVKSVDVYVDSPKLFEYKYGNAMNRITKKLYDDTLDGNSAKRYFDCLNTVYRK